MVAPSGPSYSSLGFSSSALNHNEVHPTTPDLYAFSMRNSPRSCPLSWEALQVPTWSYLSGPQALELLLAWSSGPVSSLGMVTPKVGLGEGGG